MNDTGKIIRGIIILVLGVVVFLVLLIRALKRSDDPAVLVFKWVITVPLIGIMIFKVAPMVAEGGYGAAFGGIPYAAVCGLGLAIVWRKSIASIVARPFSNLYDGGDVEDEPKPFYSSAVAKRKRGNYDEAITLIRGQLEKFPADFEGQLMIAEIQAENLNDLAGAEVTIHRLSQQPEHPPRRIAFAFNLLADWYLKFNQDREAARLALEKIIGLMPESEMSALASQRIAHLASTEHLLAYHDRRRLVVSAGVQDVGLVSRAEQPKAPEVDLSGQTADYIKHLQEHPLDTEVREKLAILYADHYRRLDLASDQLEQLISHPSQPAKRVVHWLNVLADLQVRHGGDYETVRQTLQRIVDLFPNVAAAEAARQRLAYLKLELKGKQQGTTVKLGTYEQDIGLKGGLPNKL